MDRLSNAIPQSYGTRLWSAIVFLMLPTVIIAAWTLQLLQSQIVEMGYWTQVTVLSLGLFFGLLLYVGRLRFWPSYLLIVAFSLLLKHAVMYMTLAAGLDSFFVEHKVSFYLLLFNIGILVSYLLYRVRWSSILIGASVVVFNIRLLVGSSAFFNLNESAPYLWIFLCLPALFYALYISFISWQLPSKVSAMIHTKPKLLSKTIGFIILFALLALPLVIYQQDQIAAFIERQLGGASSGDGEGSDKKTKGLLKNEKDGKSNNDELNLDGNSTSGKDKLLFAAFIDNFFPDSDDPNPLYLTYAYYTKFDLKTETFRMSSDMPDKDLFRPRLDTIPLYKTVIDTSVLAFSNGNKLLKEVTMQLYNVGMSSREFLAPTTAYEVQPIGVPDEYKNTYRSAYKAKSRVSYLNSAYFIYSTTNATINKFQKQRYEELRKVKGFEQMDQGVYAYYTALPKAALIDSIRNFTIKRFSKNKLPIDVVLSIKDYFTTKSSQTGQPLFKYKDNPGEPDIPSASKLTHFLFKSREGYCAHYAGTTMIMLRSLGIPCRIVAGFLTEDRSTVNKGWYYFYQSQAHAWVQVYLPSYGWLDFDTTIGNDENREAQAPDKTPPNQPEEATLVMNGTVLGLNKRNQTIKIAVDRLVLAKKEWLKNRKDTFTVNAKHAKIYLDTVLTSFNRIEKQDKIIAVSFDPQFIQLNKNVQNYNQLNQTLSKGVKVESCYIYKKAKEKEAAADTNSIKIPWLLLLLIGSMLFLILLITFPRIYYLYLKKQTRKGVAQRRLFYLNKLVQYSLCMNHAATDEVGPIERAAQIDQKYQLGYRDFAQKYLQLKYSDTSKEEVAEWQTAMRLGAKTLDALKRLNTLKQRVFNWMHTLRAVKFMLTFKK